MNKTRHIEEYRSKNMEFFVPPKVFVGQKLTDVVQLSNDDKKALKQGFKEARKEKETREVPYTTADKQFLAKITYLKNREQYSVRVTQAAKADAKIE